MPIFAARRPSIWTCRSLTEYTEPELRFAARFFHVLRRGDLYLA